MSIPCRTIQLLEPEIAAGLEVVDSVDPAVYEEGNLALTVGVAQYNVLFNTPKLEATYDFTESDISNDVDGDPLVLVPTVNERRVDGFTLDVSALPDTANYVYRWTVQLDNV